MTRRPPAVAARVPATARRLLALTVALIALIFPGRAFAHAVGLSRGDYVASGDDVGVELTMARGDALALAPDLDANHDGTLDDAEVAGARDVLARAIPTWVEIHASRAPCTAAFDGANLTEQDGFTVRARFACGRPVEHIEARLPMLERLPHGHRHIVHASAGALALEDYCFRSHESFDVGAPLEGDDAKEAPPSGFVAFFGLGVRHILDGTDHLLFLFGLILVGGRWKSLVGVVTAFTVAHSISLALAVLGVWAPAPKFVEPMIAASIAYVGIENLFVQSAERRWRITFPFGFVHGFGFAGALINLGLPRAEVPPALLAFNLGVETAQLGVLALVLPLVMLLRRHVWFRRWGVRGLSVGIAIAGLVWFVARVHGA